MTHLIYRHTDSNMGGDSWEWCLYVSKESGGSWTLSGELLPVLDSDPVTIDPVFGIKDGTELYDRFRSVLISNDTGIDPQWIDVEQVRQNLLEVDQTLLDQFLEGRSTFEEREEEKGKKERERRGLLIEPFSSVIKDFLERFPDDPRKYRGSVRRTIRTYVENHLIDYGELPTGLHDVPTVGGTTLFEPSEVGVDLGQVILSTDGEYFLFIRRESTGLLSLRPVMIVDEEVIWEDSIPLIHGIESGSQLFNEVFQLLEWLGLGPESVDWDELIEKLNQIESGLGDDFERDEYESIHWDRLHGKDQETD
tara:strand:+ start:34 stop:957 length:924 start_codon:yes stop_codon:yes gene_type:complete